MVMKKLKHEVNSLVGNELARANSNYPLFNSPHEGYAVIKEELEEAYDEMAELNIAFNELWAYIKANEEPSEALLHELEARAIDAACEMIQASAMIRKYTKSSKQWEEIE